MSQEHDNELMDAARRTWRRCYGEALAYHVSVNEFNVGLIYGYAKLPQDCGHGSTRTIDGRCAICGQSL